MVTPLSYPPAPPLFNDQKLNEEWIMTFPTEGGLRNDLMASFRTGIAEMNDAANSPEFSKARGNLGALQKWKDKYDSLQSGSYNIMVNSLNGLIIQGKSGKIIYNSGPTCEFLRLHGNVVKYNQVILSFIDEIMKPGPSPSPLNGKKDAEAYFYKELEEQKKISYLNVKIWIGKVIVDSQDGINKYAIVTPQTLESKYFLDYYTVLNNLAKDKRPDIIDEEKRDEEINKFWSDYKWWIIGGGVVIGGVLILVRFG